jgi:predicted ArsR family transcriptional regulator
MGISHGLASHHLRQLAKYGFVEQVGGKDNRERPWRAVHTSHSWPNAASSSEAADATHVLEEVFAERALSRFLDWQRRRSDWAPEWLEHTGVGQSTVYLTLAELAELNATIEAAIGRYIEERPIDDISTRPVGSVPIDVTLFVVPLSKRPDETGEA